MIYSDQYMTEFLGYGKVQPMERNYDSDAKNDQREEVVESFSRTCNKNHNILILESSKKHLLKEIYDQRVLFDKIIIANIGDSITLADNEKKYCICHNNTNVYDILTDYKRLGAIWLDFCGTFGNNQKICEKVFQEADIVDGAMVYFTFSSRDKFFKRSKNNRLVHYQTQVHIALSEWAYKGNKTLVQRMGESYPGDNKSHMYTLGYEVHNFKRR